MVQAILEEKKTQTRRLVRPQPVEHEDGSWVWHGGKALLRAGYGAGYVHTHRVALEWAMEAVSPWRCKRLWVKETFLDNALPGYTSVYFYRADGHEKPSDRKWVPAIHMPRKACRIELDEVTIRVERLQEIRREDIFEEGGDPNLTFLSPVKWYENLWDELNGKSGFRWEKNPWVWVIGFRRYAV